VLAHETPRLRRPRRSTVVAAGIATAVGLAAALTLPIVHDERSTSASVDLRGQLQQIADAQDSWHAAHGEYSTSLEALGLGEPAGDVAIVRADDATFCAGGYDSGTRTSVFYTPADGFSSRACP
jgi:hypothetical protein